MYIESGLRFDPDLCKFQLQKFSHNLFYLQT